MNEQLYRFFYTHGVGLIALTVSNILVMGLVWRECSLMRPPSADESTELNDNNTRGINDANGSSNYPVD